MQIKLVVAVVVVVVATKQCWIHKRVLLSEQTNILSGEPAYNNALFLIRYIRRVVCGPLGCVT